MELNKEFVDSLRQEIDALSEYYNDFDEKGHGKRQFEEYQTLFEDCLTRLEESGYDLIACKACMQALGAVCNLRLQDCIENINVDEPEYDDETCQEMIELTIKFLNNSIERIPAFSIKNSIMLMILKAIRPKWGACETIKNMSESQKEELVTNLNKHYSSYEDDLMCSKYGAVLLENLMGEFSEFDSILERIT